jgi:hypothetical protein
MSRFKASDEFIAWAQSLSGMLTKIRTDYGGISKMVERPDWDENKTDIAVKLLNSLGVNVNKVKKELADHVSGKFG